MIRAFFTNRKGAGCVRPVKTAEEAEKILLGGYSALEVRLEDENREVVGERIHQQDNGFDFEDGRVKWYWWYDQSIFSD